MTKPCKNADSNQKTSGIELVSTGIDDTKLQEHTTWDA